MTKKFNKEKFLKGCKNFTITASYAVIAVALMSKIGFALEDGSDTIFGVAAKLIDDIKGELLMLSSGAVTIAVGCGVFMKKFSMGKQDKIEMGNKLIRDSIIGFVVLNSMTYITTYIQKFATDGAAYKTEAITGFFQNLM